ncbi:hypothetical protein Poly51_45530 [Rubripirellula tenax]|uniref:Uncharacterized protein n=1 Tax=Rubripirellula tenax TaxID=2528015 RepID=A0A5C6EHZ8_9BACT|nr:hypothetical protein [Rubripirellula tenax]TWU48652.1 hypothetical protein Poly51_45530 [Rubripirellula tenax]
MSLVFFGRVPLGVHAFLLVGLLAVTGCGESTDVTAGSSSDELTSYLAEHPELNVPDTQGDGE